MELFYIIVGIAILSILWALISLRSLNKGIRTNEVKKILKKGRVVFHHSSASSSKDSSTA